MFTIKLPKDFGTKKLSWTIVANGFTNTITLHTNADYIVEPFEDAANKEHAAEAQVPAERPDLHGTAEHDRRRSYTGHGRRAVAADGVDLGRRAEDQHARSPARRGAGRRRGGSGGTRGRGCATHGATGAATAAARHAARRRGFTPPPPMARHLTKFRGPGDVKFDNNQSDDRSRRRR